MKINFNTGDGVKIVGNWLCPAGAAYAALLLHMMPAVKESYAPLQKALEASGVASFAIDLRGHGESTQDARGEILDYKNFTDAQHQASRLDVDAAFNFLKSKEFDENKIALVGASIGANLAIDAMARYKEIKRAVALSPGLDYRGVKTDSAIKNLNSGQKIWLIAGQNDEYSAQSVAALHKIKEISSQLTVFPGPDHGTNLFSSQKTLVADIVKFICP